MTKRQSKNKKTQKGQATVEYFVMFAAVVLVLIIFLGNGGKAEETLHTIFEGEAEHVSDFAKDVF